MTTLTPPHIPAENLAVTEQDALAIATHRHYKGGLYRVIGTALHTETQEQVVVYQHIWPHEQRLFVRPLEMFFENLPDGTPRFRKLHGDELCSPSVE